MNSTSSQLGALIEFADTSRRWIALPAFSSNGGTVQTIADLRSNDRMHIAIDQHGALSSIRRDSVPLGIAGTVRHSDVLLMVNMWPSPQLQKRSFDSVFQKR